MKLTEDEILEAAAKHPKLSTGHLINEWQKVTAGRAEKSLVSLKRSMQRKLRKVKQESNGCPATGMT